TGGTADRNRSHWRTSKTPSYTKSVSWHHYPVSDEIKPCRNNYLPGIIFLQQDVMTRKGIILTELYPHFIKFDVTIPS
ncbi:hypothetical protein, partial [Enterobacter roggenkampii]|uniref:hypothetical protein n=1 Tax=Enterobacter roggenkampii TaxID=1812935 RepID=UPI0020051119